MEEPQQGPEGRVAPVGWIQWFRDLLAAPVQFLQRSLTNVMLFLYVLLVNPQRRVTDPRGDVRRFVESLSRKYEQNSLIPWLNLSFDEACREAKRQIRFLFVYLHDESASPHDNDLFLQTFLLTEQFQDLLANTEALAWGASAKTDEGYNVGRMLRVPRYPFLAVFASGPEDGFQCIFRTSGTVNAEDLFTMLAVIIADQQPFLQTLIQARQRRDTDRQILREQEDEYARSLAADQARLRERQRLVSEREEQQRVSEAEQQRLQGRVALIERMRASIRPTLPAEPAPGQMAVRLKIHFLNGSFISRRFHPTDRMEVLFNVVLLNEHCPHNFSLLTGHPLRVLNCAPKWYKEEFGMDGDGDGEEGADLTFDESGLDAGVGHLVRVRDNEA